MNAYTTSGQARIQPRDFSAVLRANSLAGASLARLEWQRGCQANAEVDWRLKHKGAMRHVDASSVSLLRQTLGAALVHAGERLAGVPRIDVSPETTPAAGTLQMAD